MDHEGLPLDMVRPSGGGPDLEAIGAEMAGMLREAGQAGLDVGLGPLAGLAVRGEGPTMAFRAWGPDCFLAVVLDRMTGAGFVRRLLAETARHDHPTQ
jgi:predicted regulator of Ras-like GTPase activity (Roadblock/LC7/MglB family)